LQAFETFGPTFRVDALPRKKKTIKIMNGDWLNFRAQSIDREPMNSRQQPAVTPFLLSGRGAPAALIRAVPATIMPE